MRQGVTGHERAASNYFMGTSQAAYQANLDLLHVVAYCLLMRRRNPGTLLSLENPAAKLSFHPLMQLAERPESDGGLGLLRGFLNYCGAPNSLSALASPKADAHSDRL